MTSEEYLATLRRHFATKQAREMLDFSHLHFLEVFEVLTPRERNEAGALVSWASRILDLAAWENTQGQEHALEESYEEQVRRLEEMMPLSA